MIELKNKIKIEPEDLHLKLEKSIFKYDGQVLVGIYRKNNGTAVILSWCDRDYNDDISADVARYYSIPVSEKEIEDYLSLKITLKEIIQNKVFAIFEDVHEENGSEVSSYYKVNINDFPDGYMPQNDSYCPA